MSERGRLKINSNERLIMSEFSVKQWRGNGNYYISDSVRSGNYLHRDGEVVNSAAEYWRTKKEAEAVLEKFYPKHVWKHGDVFTNCGGSEWLYVNIDSNKPFIICLSVRCYGDIDIQMAKKYDVKFLFNIKDKL